MTQIGIVTPVFNDWPSFKQLILRIDALDLAGLATGISIMAVNDGSFETDPALGEALSELKHITKIEVVHLVRNLGHQRAIAVGLTEISQCNDISCVVVMDSDGEDKPEDILRLLQLHAEEPDHVIVARRQKRSEGQAFRVFYWLYKQVFFLLVGIQIDFGNFSLIPSCQLARFVHDWNIWNNYAAALIYSKAQIIRIDTERGHRIDGQSKMNITSLVMHGLSAVSVFTDVVIVRIVISSVIIFLMALIGLLAVFFIRYITDLAIPGWATTVAGFLLVVLIQIISFSIITIFVVLNNRARPFLIPIQTIQAFIDSRELVYSK